MTVTKEQYAAMRAAGRCVSCRGLMFPEWGGYSRCPTCREERVSNASRAAVKHKREANRRRARARYHADVEAARAAGRARTLALKLKGQCRQCSEPVADGAMRCARHHEIQKAADRAYRQRRRNGEEAPPRTRKPLPERVIVTEPRPVGRPPKRLDAVLRALSHFDAVTTQDLRDAMEIPDDEMPAFYKVVERAAKSGRAERLGGSRHVGTYRLTQAGREYLAGVAP